MGRPELGVDAGLRGRKEEQVGLRARALRSPGTMKQVAGRVTLCGPCFSSVEGAQDPHRLGLRRQSRSSWPPGLSIRSWLCPPSHVAPGKFLGL